MNPVSYLTPYEPSSIPIPEPKSEKPTRPPPTRPSCHLIPIDKEKNNSSSGISDLIPGLIALLFWSFIFLTIKISPELLKTVNYDSTGSGSFLIITTLWFITILIFAYQVFPAIMAIYIIITIL